MSTPQPQQQPVNDDLEALIDLLALDDDDDEDLTPSQQTVKAFPNPNTQGRGLNNEVGSLRVRASYV